MTSLKLARAAAVGPEHCALTLIRQDKKEKVALTFCRDSGWVAELQDKMRKEEASVVLGHQIALKAESYKTLQIGSRIRTI